MGMEKSRFREENGKMSEKGKEKENPVMVESDTDNDDDEEEEDDEEGLNEFENDGFIVDDYEEEEEENPIETHKKKKKRKRRSMKAIVLDEDDLELIRENKISGFYQEKLGDGKFKRLKKAGVDNDQREHFADYGGLLYDDMVEEDVHQSNDEENDMADFIDGGIVNEKTESLRQKNNREAKHSSSRLEESKSSFAIATANELLELRRGFPFAPDEPKESDTDKPERMQILEDIVGSSPVDEMSIEEESSWILSQLRSNTYSLFDENREDTRSFRLIEKISGEDIKSLLELDHVKKYDIPFIAMYRKELCLSLLEDPEQDDARNIHENDTGRKHGLKQHKILWVIMQLDKKWLRLQKQKSTLMAYYSKRFEEECQRILPDVNFSSNRQLFESITNILKMAQSEIELDDIDKNFNLHFPPSEEHFNVGYKRPMKKSYYSICSKEGLQSLASKFGNLEKFRQLITLDKVGMEIKEDPDKSPEEMALMYTGATFESSEAVLKGARHMAAVKINSEVSIRKHARGIFMEKALVSTSPTQEGDRVVDSFHQFAGVKWLRDKPLLKFEDAQWLFIQKAEEEKLLQVKFSLLDLDLNELTMIYSNAYLNGSGGTSTQLWNEQRKLILQDAISNFLLPSMEKEARALLTAKAKNWLLMEYGKQLWNRVSVAPYGYKNNVTSPEKGSAPRVMACCWGPGKPTTTFVILNSKGQLVDVLQAGSLTIRSQNMIDQQRRKHDQQRVLKFLMNHQPHVVVIGAASASCTRLRDDINEIISVMMEENAKDLSEEMKGLKVVLGEEGLPCLYEHSDISEDQLPRQEGFVKRAVALGRYLLNPLAMVATLCGVKKEIVSWKLTSLERFLTSDEKLEMIEWVMVDITNQVGIDINLAICHDWLITPLQFISGLGPRRASVLRRELLGAVGNRWELTKYGLSTKKVFLNAVGFLKVSCDEHFISGTAAKILDGTRIHPESYYLAEELARAVHRHNIQGNLDTDASLMNVIEYIQDDPKLLKGFDLDEYAEKLQMDKGIYKRETLYDIKMELLDGFKDPRRPYKEPIQDEEFHMITGEAGDIPLEGRKVQAIVRHVQPRQAFCTLDSGLTGVLFKEDYSDETDDISLTEKLHEGVVLTCKIKLIDKNRYRANLTSKESELKSDGDQCCHDMDPYYCQGNIILPSQQRKTAKEEFPTKNFKPRSIFHSHFQNITAEQAKEFLADKAIGEYIFHPSSRSPCYLTLTLKAFDGLYVHKDIVELLGQGKTLKVGEEIFEDIDKVTERYVNPLVVHLKAMLDFQKFKKGSKAEVDELLKVEKEEHPNRIAYGFGISYEHPGTFILSYIRSINPHHEFIGIHPKGFKFRKQIFEKVEQLVAYFQKHVYDTIVSAKNRITSNNLDQHQQSSGNNDHGYGYGRRPGCGRGHGFGRVSGSRNDSSDGSSYKQNDDNDCGWGQEQRHRRGGRQGNGQGRGREDGGNSFGGGWGSTGSDLTGVGGDGNWANAKSSGWGDNRSKSWCGGDGTTNFNHQNRYGSNIENTGGNQGVSNDCGWEQRLGQVRGRGRTRGWSQASSGDGRGRGCDGENYSIGWGDTRDDQISGGGDWADVNSSKWGVNINKSWGESNLGEGNRGGSTNFNYWKTDENGMQATGSNQGASNDYGRGRNHSDDHSRGRGHGHEHGNSFGGGWSNAGSNMENAGNQDVSNDCGWEQRKGRGRGRGRTQGWSQASRDDDRGRGYDGENSSDGWGYAGNDQTGGGGDWANTNSSKWGGNNKKSWGENNLGEGNRGGSSNFSYQKTHENYHGTLNDYGGGWGRGRGRGRGPDDGQGRGLGRGHDNNFDGGGRSSGSDHTSGGGWANSNSSGWGGNKEGGFNGGSWHDRSTNQESRKTSYGDKNDESGGNPKGWAGSYMGGSSSGGNWCDRGKSKNAGCSTWGGNSGNFGVDSNDNDNKGKGGWENKANSGGKQTGWGAANTNYDSENSGWGASQNRNATPSDGGGSGWGGNGGRSW
ncbi:hypothetical protein L6164_017762 [Bauhinia variegata]|uniref:Uncharacterized protein n=1 Tax=Bauhinia variegata TaxID=167791 RepID=A0ACB9N946_BAUVA|nr:hypothetical protein L6164_017762 [Bauhinia variegata]